MHRRTPGQIKGNWPPNIHGYKWMKRDETGFHLWQVVNKDPLKIKFTGILTNAQWEQIKAATGHTGEELQPQVDEITSRRLSKTAIRPSQAQPHVARESSESSITDEHPPKVVSLDAARDKRLKTQQDSAATRGQGKLRKSQPPVAKGKPYVEAVGASVGTMAFRLRWRENGKRQPPIYVSRVSMDVYEMIKGGDYEAFKQQLVSSHMPGAIRASHTA
jgi:hypothetical protein